VGILVGLFDLWFVSGHVALTALTGCTVLAADPALAALWGGLLAQLSARPLVLLQDSLPFPARLVGSAAHRFALLPLTPPTWPAFCVACTWLLISARFPDDGGEDRRHGWLASPPQICLSSHLTLAPLAMRFLYRALRCNDVLVCFCRHLASSRRAARVIRSPLSC
jgi:hypothetical protein